MVRDKEEIIKVQKTTIKGQTIRKGGRGPDIRYSDLDIGGVEGWWSRVIAYYSPNRVK
jgi:hypothetical protein